MRQGAAEAEGGTEGWWVGRGEVHEEHEGDGHELFMNVSMKGSKKEAGRASEGMAASKQQTLLLLLLSGEPCCQNQPPLLQLQLQLQLCLPLPAASFTSQRTKTTAHYLILNINVWHERLQRAQVKIRSPPILRQWGTAPR